MSGENVNTVSSSDLASATAVLTPSSGGSGSNNNSNAATQLSEAIDDFLADVEKRFKIMNNEILTKLDDMAERCDRLEAELLLKEAEGSKVTPGSTENSS